MGEVTKIIENEPGNIGTAITPADMLNKAIEQGVGVEVVEKFMDMHARWEAMQARKAFDSAMADLREVMPVVTKNQKVKFKNKNGGFTDYVHEDLSDVTSALSPVMAGVGLSFRWRTDSEPGSVKVTCVVTHRDGHSEETALTSGVDNSGGKNAIQAIGSAVTYLQRYTLKAAIGIAAARDDDGQSAGARTDMPAPKSKADSRETYDRLSKANAALKTVAESQKFWSQPKVMEALASLPNDWQTKLVDEQMEHLEALKDLAEPFPGDTPFDDTPAPSGDDLNPKYLRA
jgi:ERF superfamily protein